MRWYEEIVWAVIVIICSVVMISLGFWVWSQIPDDPFGLGELDL